MADAILEFDPSSEASGSPLTITTGNYGLTAFSAPAPPPRFQWASSVDTEGSSLASRGHENRTISVTLEVTGDQAVYDLQQKLSKVHREGGTLKYTTPAAIIVTFDVLAQEGFDPAFDHLHYLGGVTTLSFSLPCKPYGRGAEVDLGDNVETTLPALVFTEASVGGDVPALGRLVIDDDSAVDQWWLTWGLQSRYYSSSANAALFYEAETRTALGGSATAVGPSGASGAGSNVMRNTSLTTGNQGILSTQATGGGAHLSHVGTFRVYARVQVPTANTGLVTVALEWGEGDYLSATMNAATEIPATHEGKWRLVDLGLVTLNTVTGGTQRWEGRVLAKSTVVGDDIDIDYLLLIPTAEGSGIVSGVARAFTPTSFVGRDEFTGTTAGSNLNARVAPIGGTWATSADATDFIFADSGGWEGLTRNVASGTAGRLAVLGTTNYTNVQVECLHFIEALPTGGGATLDVGVLARWTDANNHVRASFQRSGATTKTLVVSQLVASVETVIATAEFPAAVSSTLSWWKVRMSVYGNGRVVAVIRDWVTDAVMCTAEGTSSALATGGTLATGEPGIWDRNTGTNVFLRFYDEIFVSVPPLDAAMFASQSLELRHDRINREDSGGTLWNKPSSYEGDYLLVPPSGAEARATRMVVKDSRTDPFEADSAIDDISARLFVTPRFLVLPDPSP